MRILGWKIEGFGHFCDEQTDDLAPGLTVFYGANEAGKSTLLAFLRGALFGFPHGNSSEARYPPLAGGRHGGRITLESDGRKLIVERIAKAGRGQKVAVTLEDGAEGSEADLMRALGHADKELFRSVFAFGLSELQSLATLTREGVQDRIFSAGITGAGQSARSVLSQIDERASKLYRARGASRVGTLLEKLAELESELARRRAAALAYADQWSAEQELRRQLDLLRSECNEARTRETRANKLRELWSEVWNPLASDREALGKIEPGDPFPDGGMERLQRLGSGLESAEEKLQHDVEERESLVRELEALPPDPVANSVASEVERLWEGLALQRSQLARSKDLRAGLGPCQQRVAEMLRDLGSDWSEERLVGFDLSMARRGGLREWEDRLAREQRAVGEREQLAQLLEARHRRALELRDELRSTRDAVPAPDAARRSEAEDALRRLRASCAELALSEARRAERRAAAAGSRWRSLLPAGAALSLAAFLTYREPDATRAALEALIALREPESSWVAAAALALGAIAAWLGLMTGVRALIERKTRVAEEPELEALRQAISQDASVLELASAPTPLQLEDAARALDRERTALADWQRASDRLEHAERALADGQAELESQAASAARADERSNETQREWQQWKRESGLPESLAPETAAAFLEEIRRGKDALLERDAAARELEGLVHEMQDWEGRARRALDAAGDERCGPEAQAEITGSELIEKLATLRERCARERSAAERREPLERRRVDLTARIGRRKEQREAAERELHELLSNAGAQDSEEFERLALREQTRGELEERCRRQEAELLRRVGRGSEANALMAELENGRVAAWELEAEVARALHSEKEQERDEALRRHQDALSELEGLEISTAIAELELERNSTQEELRSALREWRRLQVAGGLVRKTRERFERERQPEVLREASHFFAAVTAHRYAQIVQSTESDGFAVLDAGEMRKSPEELSRGTAEQLYLCIRLGLVAEFGRRSTQLPVVMDDVLVNFDDDRAQAMAAVLCEFAREHQLLVFTCNARTRDLLAAASSSTQLRELGG